MKKAIYIVLAVSALGMTSCSKQDIRPSSSSDTVIPVWKSFDTGINEPCPSHDGNLDITDPNNDPELESSGS